MNENSSFTNNLPQRDNLFGSERGKPMEERLSIKPKKRNGKIGGNTIVWAIVIHGIVFTFLPCVFIKPKPIWSSGNGIQRNHLCNTSKVGT